MQITLIKPDDWHLHLRDGDYLTTTVAHTASQFARAIIMPNLRPPVTTVAQALSYQQRIINAIPQGNRFIPLMTLYLTDNTNTNEIQTEYITAVKLYPAGATTNSDAGVTHIKQTYSVLEAMQKVNMPLLLHGEVTTANIDIFDREKRFIEQQLIPLTQDFPELKIVFEHITTKEAVDFVLAGSDYIAATITPHHLVFNRNDLLVGGIRPHHYCLPILKRSSHQEALIQAAISGNKKFFLGTDSAPHRQSQKHSACGCAGIYSAPLALECYAQVFEQANALDKLEAFASIYGPEFYGLPCNQSKITLAKQDWQVAESYDFGEDKVVPLYAGQVINWRLI